jgi:GntR family transcriptional regulator/MocR family aminotransferase
LLILAASGFSVCDPFRICESTVSLHPAKDAVFNIFKGADMVPLIRDSGKPFYEQIYEFYKEAILNKRLKTNVKLPSYRALAGELGVANNTVLKAYEQLIVEGYVRNENRRGLFVTRIDLREWEVVPVKKSGLETEKNRVKKSKPDFNASVQLVDEKNFPLKQWRKCSNWALDHISFQYEEHEQHDPLKDQLIKYLFHSRGVQATPERLLIGSGASVLVFWLAMIFRKTCKKVVIEEPGYPRIRFAFSEFGYDIRPVPVNHDGIDLQKLAKEKADLIYLTPSHQYPTGAAIPVDHRIEILNWATKNKAWIIEDDFDCEFRYKTKLMPALQGLDQSNRVIYVGTFSSALMPSLRVAYLVLPENFSVPYELYRYLTNTVPFFTRKTLAHFMEGGYWERHLKRMRNVYKKKYDACIGALKRIPKNHIQFNHAPSGLNILLRINTRLSEAEIVRRAVESGILITPASDFYVDKANRPQKPEILFEFGSLPQDQIEKIVNKLYKAWFGKSS